MELVRHGDARALEVIFDRHADAGFSLAYRMCGSAARAEDVVQEAFLSLWRTGVRYDRLRGSVRSWVLSAVHDRALDALRRDLSIPSWDVVDERLTEQLRSPVGVNAQAERHDDATRVRSALEELPTDQRRVVELAYFGGFTHSQIADMLGVPAGTAKGTMRLGLTKLQFLLGSVEGGSG